MKVILLSDVKNVGKKDDIVEVADGYARNFLLKRRLAVPHTQGSMKVLGIQKEEERLHELELEKQAEDIKESIRVLKEKLTDVLENRSERNRWISQFTQFATLETLDRRALIHMVQSIRVEGKKELAIAFTYEDEYKKALQLIKLAAQNQQTEEFEHRKAG